MDGKGKLCKFHWVWAASFFLHRHITITIANVLYFSSPFPLQHACLPFRVCVLRKDDDGSVFRIERRASAPSNANGEICYCIMTNLLAIAAYIRASKRARRKWILSETNETRLTAQLMAAVTVISFHASLIFDRTKETNYDRVTEWINEGTFLRWRAHHHGNHPARVQTETW